LEHLPRCAVFGADPHARGRDEETAGDLGDHESSPLNGCDDSNLDGQGFARMSSVGAFGGGCHRMTGITLIEGPHDS
jgi:hypothetical protein